MTKEAKAEYDRKYRKKNRARIKARQAAYFQSTYDPVKAAKERQKKMPEHVEYCRRPEYKTWKKKYDRQHRLSKYGEFAEAYALLLALEKEIREQMPDRFERYAQAQRKQWNPINQQRRKRGNIYRNTDSI